MGVETSGESVTADDLMSEKLGSQICGVERLGKIVVSSRSQDEFVITDNLVSE